MSDTSDLAPRSEVFALAARIRELEALLVRSPFLPGGLRASTDCTNCGSNCTDCGGDGLRGVLLPGEEARLSGGELVKRLRSTRGE